MSIFERLKNAVTGDAAKITLTKCEGERKAGGIVTVRIEVSANQDLTVSRVVADLHGEDNLDENALEKLGELFNPDPNFTYALESVEFALKKGETRVFEGELQLPDGQDYTNRHWLVRGRLEIMGRDPASGWTQIKVTHDA